MNIQKIAMISVLAALTAGQAIAQKPARKPNTLSNQVKSQQAKTKAAAQARVTPNGTVLVEEVKPQPGKLLIPYQKHVLKNGLTLIIHEDHSDPIVHVDVTYHVGSAREEIGKSGFAHFFEHMMFQGSDNVDDEAHFKIVSEGGGTLNGTTNKDRTNYFETMPNNMLETGLWLEADRMGFLLDAVTQKKFEIQRATVKNERGQNYDNRPYGLSSEVVAKTLYPYGHPYSWLTIGYVEDLDRVDVNDLKNFFMRWYGPNNATLTVGGDVKPEEVIKLAEKYFGSIPRGPEVAKAAPTPVKLEADRYAILEDQVMLPALFMTLPTVPRGHKDEAPLDALADILGGSKNSLLYQNLVKKELAVQAAAYHPAYELSGEFSMYAFTKPGTQLAEIEKVVKATIAEFGTRGVLDDDLQRFKASFESSTINGLATVSGKVSDLASYETFYGNPNKLQEELNARLNLTKEDVMAAYNKYVKGKPAVILSVVPKGQTALAASQNLYVVDQSKYKAPKDEYSGLTYNKAKDNFDRSKRPALGPNPVVSVPDFYTENLPNGIKLIGAQNTEIPTTTLYLAIKGGHRLVDSPKKAGLADLLADMMDESTQNYSAEEFENELEKIGARINVSASDDNYFIYLVTLTKNLDKAMALFEEVVTRPAFKAEDFERVKAKKMQLLNNQSVQPTYMAEVTFGKLVYGENNIVGHPVSGTPETIKDITLDEVKAFYKKAITPSLTNVVIVGDQPKSFYASKLGFLRTWQGAATKVPANVTNPNPPKAKIYFVNKDNAPQSQIRVGYLALPYDATGEYYKANIMNFMLGGAFNSKINLNLREDKGWTYGARSGFSGSEYPGYFVVSTGVKATATDSSLVEILKDLKDYREKGISEEDLKFVQSSLNMAEARNYESGFQKANFLSRILTYNLPKDFTKQQTDILLSYTTNDVKTYAQKYLPVENMYIVVVGDKDRYMEPLKRLGLEIEERDSQGNPIMVQAPAVSAAPILQTEEPTKGKKGKKSKKDKKKKKK